MLYEIQSGMPAGEVYHRWIFAARTAEEAEDCRKNIAKLCERYEGESESDNWLWGPHIYERDERPMDERDEAPAEFWSDYVGRSS